ncbi:uncharacterized protein LOC110692909 [Chenopodium quinoa]|uniref:uncharacterized protein LOC110692909 n=1 Tax=Chenopodium quinoa TaxID=63459 RepID=UPI000B785123|nr:uncharacterized protein LOC110692909 [Chenopodium quinoa]
MARPDQIAVEFGHINQPVLLQNSDKGIHVTKHIGLHDSEDYRVHLYKAALCGDWEVAKEIHNIHPNCFMEKISRKGDTALHIAAAGGRYNFVKELLAHACPTAEQLELRNNLDNTAFCLAAASGVLEIVQEMQGINPKLPNIPGSHDMKPVLIAALLGHGAMVRHLSPYCFDDLSEDDRIDLLISAINTDLYDVALEILGKDEKLAIVRNGNGETPLHVLARKPRKNGPGRLNSWRQCFNFVTNYLWGKQQEDEAKLKLVERLWKIVIKQPEETISEILSQPQPEFLFAAIELGNYEFVATLIRHYPDLIWETDEENRTIFHAAVQCRQEKIFSHIHEIEGINHLLAAYMNHTNGNNILHLAATLPSSDRLDVVSGAALQMQRELLWFQAVEEIVQREYAGMKNNPQKPKKRKATPRALFTQEHRSLRRDGERWMRDTATSCMVVATLVAAVIFQAVFQPPSHENKKLFWMFVISNAFSLVAATASILSFLAILTSRYAEEDFLVSLPLKLIIGLALLFFSIMTMLLAFTATIAIIFPPRSLAITIAVLAWMTGSFYILQHLPLLVDAYRSTFRSRYLFRPRQELFRD